MRLLLILAHAVKLPKWHSQQAHHHRPRRWVIEFHLIYGADNLFYAFFDQKPYPEGQERLAINSTIEQLFNTLQTKVDENGRTVMYQLAQPGQPNQGPSAAVGTLAERLASAFGVTVVTDPVAFQQAMGASNTAQTTGGRVPKGFVYQGAIYLNPALADTSTVLEEFTHVWNQLTRTAKPELYQRGVKLAKDSGYFKRLQADPYYRSLSVAEMEDEALAQAIADRGQQFVTEGRRTSFRQWLSDLWSFIKEKLGIPSQVDVASMSLDDFAKLVVDQLSSGSVKASGVAGQSTQFQLSPSASDSILGVEVKDVSELRRQAEAYYENPASFNLKSGAAVGKLAWTGVSPDLMALPASKLTAADKEFIKQVTKQTGWKLAGGGELTYAKELKDGVKPHHAHAYHTADNRVVRLEGYEVSGILKPFDTLYNDAGKQPTPFNRSRVFKTMFDTMARWASPETFVGWIDDEPGTLKRLVTDVRRADQRKADYVDNKLQPLLENLRQKMAPFTVGWKGSLEVPTVTLSIYDVAGDGIAVKDINLPVAQAMALVRQVETQKSSGYTNLTTVWNQPPSVEQLVRHNKDGSVSRIPRGAVYYDEQTDQTHFINIDAAQYEALRSRFVDGGGMAGETQAYQAIVDLFNNPVAKQQLAEQNRLLHPDTPFTDVADYYPLDTFENMDARQRSRQASRTLDENKHLVSRSGASPALLLQDPLTTASSYLNAVRDVLGSARLVDNLDALQTQIANDYQGKKKDAILSYLNKISTDLKEHRAKLAEKRAEGGVGVLVDAATRRYTNSVFSWNISIPLKQTSTFAAALGQGIIENKYLTSAKALETLARLTGGAYLNQDAPSQVNAETGRGFTGKLTGKTQDADLLRELMGLDIADEAAREAYPQRAATVIARATFQQSLYTGDVEWKQTGIGNAATRGGQAIKKLDEVVDTYGRAAMRRADVAVILSYMVAAQQQAQGEGLTVGTPDYQNRVADLTERVVYATNMMGQVSDQTPLQRTTDWVSKLMSLYSGQQQKLLNLVMGNLSDWAKTGSDAAFSKLAQSFGYAIVANALWVSLVSAGASALMAILSGDEPDEEWMQGVAWNFLRNVSGTVPSLASNAADYIISQNDNIRGNESFADVPALDTFKQGLDAINETKTYLLAEDEKKREKALDSAIYDVTSWLAKSSGAPSSVARLLREWSTEDADDLK